MDPLKYLTTRSTCPGPRQSDQLLRRKLALSKDMRSKDLVGHFGCVNALEFSHGLGNYLASGGDDRRVLLWDVEKALSDIGKPRMMKGEHNSNIFCVAFDVTNSTLFSGGNDEQVIVHDMTTGVTKDVFLHEDAVYGLSPDPMNPYVFASSCDDGRVLIYDTRDSTGDPFCLANYSSSMHSVMYNPVEPRLLATANAKEGVGLWDVRKPKSCVLRYGGSVVQQSCMSVRFNQQGDKIIALRRRLPPVLYKIDSNVPLCEFDHSGYYNSCTMKSVTFAGDLDQYVVSGSDEFNLYMWAVPEDLSERLYINSAHMVLKGHRSIVNQVRFNPANHLIVSSGVEKIIKAWSPFTLPTIQPDVERVKKNVRHRPVYSHEEYINLVLENGHVMSHDYSHESTDEDPRMIAFFDSLVQRELEGISSDDSLSSNEEALYSRIVQLSQSDIDTDDSFNDVIEQNSDGETDFSPFTIAFASVMASQAVEGNDRFPRLNNALNNSERTHRETGVESVELISSEVSNTDRNRGSCNISKLVQKKKLELRQTVQRKGKDCSTKSSSSSNSDLNESSDSELSDVDDVSITVNAEDRLGKRDKESENRVSENTKQLLEKVNECRKQSQLRLKKLKKLRHCVLNSDSDTSDVEHIDKKLQIECLTSTPAGNSININEPSGKVKFKKFKRKNSESIVNEERDQIKSRENQDLGPYLQRTGSSNYTNSEIKKTGDDSSYMQGKKHLPDESLTGKGKVRKESHCDLNDSRDAHNSDQQNSKYSLQKEESDSECERGNKVGLKHLRSSGPKESERRHSSQRKSSGSCHGHLYKHGSKCLNSEEEEVKPSSTRSLYKDSPCSKKENVSRSRSTSPTTSIRKPYDTEKRHIKDTEDIGYGEKHRKRDYGHKHSMDKNKHSVHKHKKNIDDQSPSCSYNAGKLRNQPKADENRSKHRQSVTSDSDQEVISLQTEKKQDTSSEDDQPTWAEFKRFKNRLERARHCYKEHKKHKKQKRHYDDR